MADDEEYALAVYQTLRSQGPVPPARVAGAAGLDEERARRGLDRLRTLGLLQEAGGLLEPVEPDTALLRTMDAYRAHAAEQAGSAADLRRLTHSLLTVYRPAVARGAAQVEVEYISDRRAKDRLLHDLTATVEETCDSLHAGPMPPMEVLERSLAEDAELVARGVRRRAVHRQTLLQTPRHARYLRELAALGVEVRLIEHAAYDLILLDRMVACLPAEPGVPGSDILVLRGSALINAQLAMYEDYWLRAVPYEATAADPPDAELTPQERVVIRLMAGGLSDDQIARRVGVHRRTVQRSVAKLMERLGATSRFEAGLRLAQDPEFARTGRRERPEQHGQQDQADLTDQADQADRQDRPER
jgi:DNA-binding CsgD family transcriptional regulator